MILLEKHIEDVGLGQIEKLGTINNPEVIYFSLNIKQGP